MRISKITGTFLLFLVGMIQTVQAQEAIGLRTDRYLGINTALLNPANTVQFPLRWDANIVALDHFTATNYLYVKDIGLFSLLNNIENVRFANATDATPTQGTRIEADYYTGSHKRYAFTQTQIQGPSLLLNIFNNTHYIGFFINARMHLSASNIAPNLSYYHYDNQPLNTPLTIDPFEGAMMAWSETGLHYGYRSEGNLSFGANLKFLNGYESLFFENLNTTDLTKVTGDSLNFPDVHAQLGFTTSNLRENQAKQLKRNGGGVALDLGVTWAQYDGDDYNYLLGVSLLDLGTINFKSNTRNFDFDSDNLVEWATLRYKQGYNIDDYDHLANSLSYDLFGDSTAAFAGNQAYRIWMPTGVSAQVDLRLSPYFYVNGTFVQRIPIGEHRLKRNNMMYFAPRFEHRWFGASLPVVIYNYEKFRLGVAVRLAYLTIGTDHLVSLFKSNEFTGTSFYVALKFNPFNINWERSGGGSGNRNIGGRGKAMGCYQF